LPYSLPGALTSLNEITFIVPLIALFFVLTAFLLLNKKEAMLAPYFYSTDAPKVTFVYQETLAEVSGFPVFQKVAFSKSLPPSLVGSADFL
jgi:hypothetical protein